MKKINIQTLKGQFQKRLSDDKWSETLAQKVLQEHQVRPIPGASHFFFQRKEVLLFIAWLIITLAPMLYGLWYSFSSHGAQRAATQNWQDVKSGYYPEITTKTIY